MCRTRGEHENDHTSGGLRALRYQVLGRFVVAASGGRVLRAVCALLCAAPDGEEGPSVVQWLPPDLENKKPEPLRAPVLLFNDLAIILGLGAYFLKGLSLSFSE